MNTLPKGNDFIYIPEKTKGEELFDGLACPTEEVYQLIGDEGIQIIRDKIFTMLEWRKTMYGDKKEEDYGFYPYQKFIDVQNEIVLLIGGTLNGEYNIAVHNAEENNNSIEDHLPKLVVPENLKKNNYEKLMTKSHFMIHATESLKSDFVKRRYKRVLKKYRKDNNTK